MMSVNERGKSIDEIRESVSSQVNEQSDQKLLDHAERVRSFIVREANVPAGEIIDQLQPITNDGLRFEFYAEEAQDAMGSELPYTDYEDYNEAYLSVFDENFASKFFQQFSDDIFESVELSGRTPLEVSFDWDYEDSMKVQAQGSDLSRPDFDLVI